jgi:alpha-L-fucosidase
MPAEGVRILKKVGEWTTANAAAIYGAGPTPFGAELGYEDAAKKDKEGKPVWIDRDDWRCTTQPGKLFFTLPNWPGEKFTIPAFPNAIKRAYLLTAPATPLRVNGRAVALPERPAATLAPVLCVEIEGAVAPSRATGTLDAKKDKES